MRDTAKQIINYWYTLECLQPKEVPKYKAIPKRYIKELVFNTENDRTTIYQQSVINPFGKIHMFLRMLYRYQIILIIILLLMRLKVLRIKRPMC